jgi:hypothetical protein
MGLSASLIYKWCQPNDAPGASGADNPLDRLGQLYTLTRDPGPIRWLCAQADGFFVPNPPPHKAGAVPLLHMTRKIVREFSELLDVLTSSIENDGQILLDEAEKIRCEWEKLKSSAEGFVLACEQGLYTEE